MKIMKKLLSICLSAVLLCLVLAGCTVTSSRIVKTGYAGSETSRSWSGRFKSYNGYESKQIAIPKGAETLKLQFSLAAEEGTLRFTALHADGRELFDPEEVAEGTWELALNPGMKVVLRMEGNQAKNGSFQLEWEFE